ncbi:MAG: acetyltransferase [Candidatus Magnetominusculus sp. LBB02]|nr:acetyltransferase [Candidatus Magnetominusculus sp. LBB02]
MSAADNTIFIYGASGHAGVVIDAVEKASSYTIAGLVESFKPIGQTLCGYKIIGNDGDIPEIISEYNINGCIIAVGDNWGRSLVYKRIAVAVPGLKFLSSVHPTATIARDVRLGRGTVVMAGAVINAGAAIGDFCIVNTNSTVEHDCVLHNYSSIGPNAAICGGAELGAYSVLSAGATAIEKVTIGEHAVVGAGSTVIADIAPYTVACGSPARPIRSRAEGERYLR